MNNKILIVGSVVLMGLLGFAFLRPKESKGVDNQPLATIQDQTTASSAVVQDNGTTSQVAAGQDNGVKDNGVTNWQQESSPTSDSEIETIITQKLSEKNLSDIQLGDVNYVTKKGKDSVLVFIDGSELVVSSSNKSLLPGNIQVRLDRTYER